MRAEADRGCRKAISYKLSDAEIARRRATAKPWQPRNSPGGWLGRYARMVRNASADAVLG